MSCRYWLLESGSLFKESFHDITTYIYRAIACTIFLLAQAPRKPFNLDGQPIFQIKGSSETRRRLVQCFSALAAHENHLGSFKNNTSAEPQPTPIKSELLGMRYRYWFFFEVPHRIIINFFSSTVKASGYFLLFFWKKYFTSNRRFALKYPMERSSFNYTRLVKCWWYIGSNYIIYCTFVYLKKLVIVIL